MIGSSEELGLFKRRINLTEYAASRGYELDRRSSSRNSAIMTHPDGDKIVIAVDTDEHWVYFSVRDPQDHGTIIDFVQRRQGGTLGAVRQLLRPWLDAPPIGSRSSAFAGPLVPATRDLVAVRDRFERMGLIQPNNPYLTQQRHIPPALLSDKRFASRIRVDNRGNVVFPHLNRDGLCGYEIKNHGFTGFASGGVKGLWSCRCDRAASRLVIAETAIDALSYAAIRGAEGARFISVGGQMNPDQPALLLSVIRALPSTGQVILALDNDAGGDALAQRIAEIFGEAGRPDLRLIHDRPEQRGMDWNDQLKSVSVAVLRYEPH